MPLEHRPAIFIETHGCKLNQADSQALARRFARAGYRLVDERDQADVSVVNTCTVTHIADRKARHALRDTRRQSPSALVVATGCYAQRSPNQLALLDGVDLVMDNTQKDTLVERVTQTLGLSEVSWSTTDPSHFQETAPLRTRAMVKIQEGCNQVCAYCIVPKVRGRERSVHPDMVVARIQRLVAEGYQEVVLTGSQLGTYGFEIKGASLPGLIRQVLSRTSVPRLRVSSLQPQELSAELLDLWYDSRLCPHFHLPLQSGSAAVLKAMRRRYSPQQYVDAVESIRLRVPRAAITTDVIVGFPGETEEQFQESHTLCLEIQFAGLHVFPYSARPGTTAARLEARVGTKEKGLRMEQMLALAKEQAHIYRQSLLGTTCPVLWETSRSIAGIQVWTGLTDNYVRVATVSPEPLYNRIVDVVLERQDGKAVWGRLA